MRIVVDANVVLAFLLPDAVGAEQLRRASRIASPELVVPEVLHASRRLERSSQTYPSLQAVIGFFERIVLVPSMAVARDAYAIASRIDHSVYDCFYAAVAHAQGASLLTADVRFAKKLMAIGFDVIALEHHPKP